MVVVGRSQRMLHLSTHCAYLHNYNVILTRHLHFFEKCRVLLDNLETR